MRELKDHVKALAKYSHESENEVVLGLLSNHVWRSEESLLCWSISEEALGKAMYVLFCSGDGKELYPMILKIAKQNNCTRIYCVTQRPRGIERKYGFRPVGTLMVMEVEDGQSI